MIEFLQTRISNTIGLDISYFDIGLFVLLFLLAVVLNVIASRFIRNSSVFQNLSLKRKRLIFNAIRIVVWLIVIGLVLNILGLDVQKFYNLELVSSESEDSTFNLKPKHFIIAFLVFAFTRIVLIGVERVFSSGAQFKEDDRGKSQAVFKFTSYFIWLIAFLIILSSTGLNLTLIWGAGAALLVGIGLGLQQIVADLVSGVFLLFEGNLREGDVVELNTGIVGRVEHVGIRTSKILTRDDYIMIIPNSQFIVKEVINWTHNEDNTRFHVNVGVAYGSDTRLVEKVLLESAIGYKDISKKPAPFVRFDNFGDSSLDFQLFFWSRKTFRIENLKSDLRFIIDQSFKDNDIQIPFPQRDIHIKSNPK